MVSILFFLFLMFTSEDEGRFNPIDNMYSFERVVLTHQLVP